MRAGWTQKARALIPLLLAVTFTLVLLDRPLIRGDGVAYLAWVDTLVRDGDIDLSNQQQRFAPVNTYQIQFNPTTDRWVIIFPFGVALPQAPFYALGDWFARNGWLNLNPDYFRQMQGVELPYSFWLMIGANALALGSVTFGYLAARRFCDRLTAGLLAYTVFLGTPLLYYSSISPMNSHSAGAFALAGFFYLLGRINRQNNGEIINRQNARNGAWQARVSPPLYAVERGSGGEDASPPLYAVERGSGGEDASPPLYAVERGSGGEDASPPLYAVERGSGGEDASPLPAGGEGQGWGSPPLHSWRSCDRRKSLWERLGGSIPLSAVALGLLAGLAVLARWQLVLAVVPGYVLLAASRRWRVLLIATVAAGFTCLPLPLTWQYLFGSPFLIPFDAVEGQGGSFLQGGNHALDVLGQLILHSPVVALSLIGIVMLWRRERGWAIMAASVIGLQLLINGAALDWWAGESYGMRRMSELYGLYSLLAGAALGQPFIAFPQLPGSGLKPIVLSRFNRFAGGFVSRMYVAHWRAVHRLVLAGFIAYTVAYIAAFLVYSWTNPAGYLLGAPDVMLRGFFDHPYRLEVLVEVVRAHVGPWAWAMPGP